MDTPEAVQQMVLSGDWPMSIGLKNAANHL
jgi:hypothetical protein